MRVISATIVALTTAALAGCGSDSPDASADAADGGRPDASAFEAGDDASIAETGALGDAAPPGDAAIDATSDSGDASKPASDASTKLGPIDVASATIYSVFPKIFSQAGDYGGVTLQLPRIRALGFNVLYLLPVTPIGKAVNGHPSFDSPYAVSDYYGLNPQFGTKDQLIALVKAAHGLGLHVILDQVLNHTSWDNALITKHPEYYEHSDNNPQNSGSIVQAFGYSDVAQLNYKTQNGLSAYIIDMLKYWVTTYDVDGFRFDTADNPYGADRKIPASFWKSVRPALESVKPGIFMLGEEQNPELALAPFQLDYGWHLQGLYGDGGLRQVATGANATLLKQAWDFQANGWPSGMRHMTLLQNWDLEEDLKAYGGTANTLAAATFNFMIDGVPMLFNGEEVGNDNSGVNTKTVINWNGPNATAFSSFYKSLLGLRNANKALQQGKVTWINNSASDHVVSFTRSDANATFLVVVNFSGNTVTGTVSAPAGTWTDVSPTGSPGGNAHAAPPSFSLKGYDFEVFRAK